MDELITQLGVGGIFVILVLREVFSFLKLRKMNGTLTEEQKLLKDLSKQTDSIYKLTREMHDWKEPRVLDLLESIKKMNEELVVTWKDFIREFRQHCKGMETVCGTTTENKEKT